MHAASPIPRPTVGRTFLIAISLMGVLAGAQIIGSGVGFYRHHRRKVSRPAASAPSAPPSSTIAVPPSDSPPEVAATPGESLPSLPMETPRPVAKISIEARIFALVEQARAFRTRGDTSSALVKLREAQALEADQPLVIAEMGSTYELMALGDKAAEQWRRLVALGERAGALAELARMKLDPGPASANRDFTGPLPGGTPGETPADALQPGSTLGLMEIQSAEENDPVSKKSVNLKIGLKARPGSEIDVRDVVIQVFFYDRLDGEHIVQTNAQVSSKWITPPADWRDDGIEILQVGYRQPLKRDEEMLPEEASREYHGYIVRVYYKDELEDVRAEPISLLTLFPPALEVETQPLQ